MTDTSDLPRADATRARLLDAATAAFAEKGFHGTATRDIATAAAGMSSAALYVHHKSKEELLYLISRTGATRTRCSWYGRGSRPRTIPAAALRTVVHDFAVHHARGHTSARIVNYELAALTPEHYAEIRDLRPASTGRSSSSSHAASQTASSTHPTRAWPVWPYSRWASTSPGGTATTTSGARKTSPTATPTWRCASSAPAEPGHRPNVAKRPHHLLDRRAHTPALHLFVVLTPPAPHNSPRRG